MKNKEIIRRIDRRLQFENSLEILSKLSQLSSQHNLKIELNEQGFIITDSKGKIAYWAEELINQLM